MPSAVPPDVLSREGPAGPDLDPLMKDSLPFMAPAGFCPEFGAKQEFWERTMRGMRKLWGG